ncbi:hypothetical protein QJS10_CPB17g01040 [Acorus calamus]|uniref:Uncharacterized protein n=1 Tax=Acorus calamus TaxID=4465 RepID=A0AAV9CYG0_ACOCL|nr:hypothetical protein QJS10_CPB17g01040 [Acorus calamus]
MDILSSDPRSLTASNLVDLIIISSDITFSYLSETVSYISKLSDDSPIFLNKKRFDLIIARYTSMRRYVEGTVEFARDPKSRTDASLEAMYAGDDASQSVDLAKELRGGPPQEMVRRGERLMDLATVLSLLTDNLE